MPVFLFTGLVGVDAKCLELRLLPEAAFEFGESGEAGESDDVVPQLRGVLVVGQPADHRAEERDTLGWLEVDDRGAHIAAGEGECLVGFRLDLGVEGLVVERGDVLAGESEFVEDRAEEALGATEVGAVDCLLYTSPSPRDS